jgi:mRNA interferase RelE/StbE
MEYALIYHPKVVTDDIPKLNGSWKKRIKNMLEQKLQSEPLLYGVPLRRNLHGCHKLRIGEYRTVYFVKKTTVYIIAIRHRKEVYSLDFSIRL